MGVRGLPQVHQLLGRLYTDAEWEALCNRCGDCCYESVWTDTGWEDTGRPCPHLDLDSLLCGAYGQRFEVEPECIRVTPSVVLSGMLPESCSYHEELRALVEEDEAREQRQRGKGRRRRRR